MIDAVMSVVITGRRMQISEMLMSGFGLAAADRHPGAVGQKKLAVGDDDVALFKTGFDHRKIVDDPFDLDRANDSGVVLNHEDELAGLAELKRRGRHRD